MKNSKAIDNKEGDNIENIPEILIEVNPLDTLIQMKKRDYNPHILIEDVKNLVLIVDNNLIYQELDYYF